MGLEKEILLKRSLTVDGVRDELLESEAKGCTDVEKHQFRPFTGKTTTLALIASQNPSSTDLLRLCVLDLRSWLDRRTEMETPKIQCECSEVKQRNERKEKVESLERWGFL